MMSVSKTINGVPPSWDALFEIAQSQLGYFTTAQAASAGYSPQLLHKYLQNRKAKRVRRGIYRLVHFPASQEEDLVPLWLWANQLGVFSHETALALHDLSDILPSRVHMTVPEDWRSRRLKVPVGLVLHYADLDENDLTNAAAVPITAPERTLQDCIDEGIVPDLGQQAVREARQRGLISRARENELITAIPGGVAGS
jgi:predicted transcriptional regulator of viral defense system